MLHKEPDWSLLPDNTPLTVRWLLQKCLTKDRKRRLHDIADARVDLELAITDPGQAAGGLEGGSLTDRAGQASGHRRGVVGLVCSVGLITALLAWFLKPSPELDRPPSRHIGVYIGAEQHLFNGRHQALRISPDGSMVAYIVEGSDGAKSSNQVFLRKLDHLDSVRLEAADGATQLAFSPDGQSIAFQVGTSVKRVSIDGEAAVPLFEAELDLVLEWTQDHGILFLDDWNNGSLRKGTVGEGSIEELTALDDGERFQLGPQILPGERGVLYTSKDGSYPQSSTSIRVQSIPGGETM
jgi:hypothetical protein